jgi:glycine dehydrogenase subunit 2
MPESSIGRVHSWHGNAVVLLRAWMYLRLNGGDGLKRVSEIAVLNANWFKERLRGTYDIAYDRPVMHECVVSAQSLHHDVGLSALDVAKRLMELGFHPPTVYFPLIVEEALMVEPTETESPQTLAALADAFLQVARESREAGNADDAKAAPRTTPVGRVDDARAARKLVVTFDQRAD